MYELFDEFVLHVYLLFAMLNVLDNLTESVLGLLWTVVLCVCLSSAAVDQLKVHISGQ